MTTLTARPFGGAADLQPMVDLDNLCVATEQLGETPTSVRELRQEVERPELDRERDLRLWEQNGRLVAYASLFSLHDAEEPNVRLNFKVHPQARGNGVEEAVLAWSEQRVAEIASEHERDRYLLRPHAFERDTARLALLARHGFTPDHYFYRMRLDLNDELPSIPLPPGYRLRPFRGAEEVEQWVEMFNLSFIDHWGFAPVSAEEVLHDLKDPAYRAELDLLAEAADGTLAGFCYGTINPEANALSGHNEGHIDVLGTRRGHRRIGLGRALLLAGVRRLAEEGVESVTLGVDATSPTGANRLYESVGFKTERTGIVHRKEVSR